MKSFSTVALAAAMSLFATTTHGHPAKNACPAKSAQTKPAPPAKVQHNFRPKPRPGFDTTNRTNLVPTREVELQYLGDDDTPGNIGMKLEMNHPAVVLEECDDIKGAVCGDGYVTVSFKDADALKEALDDWTDADMKDGFFIVTNDFGNCDEEFERGFFLAKDVKENEDDMTITVKASKEGLAQAASTCEMTFSSLPAAQLTKRITADPSVSLSFSEGLDPNTVLFTDGEYFKLVADEASFDSTVTFSGYLKYNFLKFKLESLYFDVDTTFQADLALSASVSAAYKKTHRYAPADLSYSLVSVPGLVELGPGISFGLGVDVDVSAAVGLKAGAGVSIPDGNVHVDFLDKEKTGTSGWEPRYTAYANVTEAADVRVDASADLTVELAFKLLGGLVDLSSGVTATPGFDNRFKLRGEQGAAVQGRADGLAARDEDGDAASTGDAATGDVGSTGGAGTGVVSTGDVCAFDTNGLELQTDFHFKIKAFATQWWNQELYSVTVPMWDVCYVWF